MAAREGVARGVAVQGPCGPRPCGRGLAAVGWAGRCCCTERRGVRGRRREQEEERGHAMRSSAVIDDKAEQEHE